jgi:iduronate 2-sulfatase
MPESQQGSGGKVTRRGFLAGISGALAAGGLSMGLPFGCSRFGGASPRGQKPNVLLIAVDDLFTSNSAYGDHRVKMPNLEALAKRGVLFQQAYCQYPMCNPSRTSIITGLRPTTTGILDNFEPFRTRHSDLVTLPQHFSANGYETVCIGKIMHTPEIQKTAGWDRTIGMEHIWGHTSGKRRQLKGPYFNLLAEGKKPDPKLQPFIWGPSGLADLDEPDGRNAADAIGVLKEARNKPLFLALGFFKPHLVWSAPDRFFDMYPPETIKPPQNPPDDLDDLPPLAKEGFMSDESFMTTGMIQEAIAAYYACCSWMDFCLGQVLDTLKETGQDKNTVIVLWSDHGFLLREHFFWGKSRFFEEATRSVLLVSDPRRQENAGAMCERFVELIDIYPTLIDLCGLPGRNDLEGTSVEPLLDNPVRPWKKGAFTNVFRGNILGESVRTENWRYSEYGGSDQAELYDLAADAKEFTNLAGKPEYAAKAAEMSALLRGGWKGALPTGD